MNPSDSAIMTFSSILWSLFSRLITFAFSTFIARKLLINRFPLPPGPKPLPFFGCMIQMLRNKPISQWMDKVMNEMNTEIGCFRVGGTYVVLVTSPELACEFLKKQGMIFSSRPLVMSAELASTNYLTAALSPLGDQQKKMKKIIVSSVLSPAKHSWLHDKRAEEADHLVNYVYNQCNDDDQDPLMMGGGGVVNVRMATRHYCGNVIRRMVFNKRFFGKGTEGGGPGAEEIEHVEALFTILAHLYAFSASDYIPWMKYFDLDGHKKILNNAMESVRNYQDPEIEKRFDMWENGLKHNEEDLLDVLIMLKDSNGRPLLTMEEIKAQITEIMIATVDNPPNAVEWALAEMLNKPELLEKATEELDTIVGRDRLVQEFDLPRLKYIKACIKEAFRLHPLSPFNVPRESTEDSIIAGRYFIPKGSHVIISRPGIGRNPRIWEDQPLKFKPERHLIEEIDDEGKVELNHQQLHFFAFSTGRRGCPAVVLGSTMCIMLLARLLQAFTWKIPTGISQIDLIESKNDLSLATPLRAIAKPRLSANLIRKTNI